MKELTILGRGPSWKDCDFRTEELWGAATCLRTNGMEDRKYTKVFAFDGDNVDILREAIVIAKERDIPMVSTLPYATEYYPIRDVMKEFRFGYFKNTMSYMIALACYQKYERLWIYGIDQGPGLFYQMGKPYVTFWLGACFARGIDVLLGKGSLRWTYESGQNEVPKAFIESEKWHIRQEDGTTYVGKAQDELSDVIILPKIGVEK